MWSALILTCMWFESGLCRVEKSIKVFKKRTNKDTKNAYRKKIKQQQQQQQMEWHVRSSNNFFLRKVHHIIINLPMYWLSIKIGTRHSYVNNNKNFVSGMSCQNIFISYGRIRRCQSTRWRLGHRFVKLA